MWHRNSYKEIVLFGTQIVTTMEYNICMGVRSIYKSL